MYHANYSGPPPAGYYYPSSATPLSSPSPAHTAFYSPRVSTMPSATSPRGSPRRSSHSRRASMDPGSYHASPRHYSSPGYPPTSGYFPPGGVYPSPQYVSPSSRGRQTTYQPWEDFYSSDEHSPERRPSMRRNRSSSSRPTFTFSFFSRSRSKHDTPRSRRAEPDDEYIYPSRSNSFSDRRPRTAQSSFRYGTDAYNQATQPEPRPERSRRSSHSSRATPKTKAPEPAPRSAPKATAEDCARHNIPAGYSTKNWDPTEDPIVLLGSVFDANSLGRWIYDWTVHCKGANSETAETAGNLWLLMIQVSGKMKRAEETRKKIRQADKLEMVDDFIESGERLWERFRKLLKNCETYMLKAAKRESAARKEGKEGEKMNKASGVEFVETVFGFDRELSRTEKLMQGMKVWNMRFDANCEDILKHPSA